MEINPWLVGIGGLAVGAVLTWVLRRGPEAALAKQAEHDAEATRAQARVEAENIRKEGELAARDESFRRKDEQEKKFDSERKRLLEQERETQKQALDLETERAAHNKRKKLLAEAEDLVAQRQTTVREKEKLADDLVTQREEALSRTANLTPDQAREELFSEIRIELAEEEERLVAKSEREVKARSDERARDILATAIQRVAADHSSEITVTGIDIPNDDIKGRIIGREGRNIRAFERASGVDVIVDDTPGVVLVSAFDGVRRETASRAMRKLVKDGRIHPARIEEVVKATEEEMAEHINETGKQAVLDLGAGTFHPKIVHLLGRLRYRTSYGQNVLQHSLEAAHLCGGLAAELGLDQKLAKRCGLLHDIGKAVDHEVDGGHPAIGADIAKRCGENKIVINAIAAHHNDVPMETAYSVLTAAADAASAARPGARRDTLERYIKRLQALEEIACRFDGVDQAYAIQAGREIRVLVNPNKIGDRTSQRLAREIAKAVEEELTYPGEVKVTLLREVRVTDYAR